MEFTLISYPTTYYCLHDPLSLGDIIIYDGRALQLSILAGYTYIYICMMTLKNDMLLCMPGSRCTSMNGRTRGLAGKRINKFMDETDQQIDGWIQYRQQ